jgi:hypothetical protein
MDTNLTCQVYISLNCLLINRLIKASSHEQPLILVFRIKNVPSSRLDLDQDEIVHGKAIYSTWNSLQLLFGEPSDVIKFDHNM